jgi:hypothetical protein
MIPAKAPSGGPADVESKFVYRLSFSTYQKLGERIHNKEYEIAAVDIEKKERVKC